jgi:hypothetical protein
LRRNPFISRATIELQVVNEFSKPFASLGNQQKHFPLISLMFPQIFTEKFAIIYVFLITDISGRKILRAFAGNYLTMHFHSCGSTQPSL